MAKRSTADDTPLGTYRSKRDFAATSEPPPRVEVASKTAPIFVVQKHAAHRAGLHWDFRLEHGGVLWSWAVRKGPSLDTADRRVAIHVEDHPLDYAGFQGRIPDGQYGAGTVDTWDRGTWEPLGDPDEGMQKGELKFLLSGERLRGRFTLVRLRPKPGQRQQAWFLIKGHDEQARQGADAELLEAERPLSTARPRKVTQRADAPIPGAKKAALPKSQAPELASLAEEPPAGPEWLSEIKLDGYRLLIWLSDGKARVVTRNGLDWTDRLPAVAREAARLNVTTALIDGELVALLPDGTSSFPDLQAALSAGQDGRLYFCVFDLLHLDGWDLRPGRLDDRKAVLFRLADWKGMFRYSEHIQGDSAQVRRQACRMKLEGIIAKRADAPYRSGRGHDWLKVKCQGREEFIVLGWTLPGGSRTGFGALHVGYYDPDGRLHYAGAVGTGYSDQELTDLRRRLDGLQADPPPELQVAGDPIDQVIQWVRPELVVELQYIGWSGSGRLRHAAFLGLREDKSPQEVVRDVADPLAARFTVTPKSSPGGSVLKGRRRPKIAVPPRQQPPGPEPSPGGSGRIVVAKAPKRNVVAVGSVELTHADRPIWPGITKQDLAEYWQAVAKHALPGLARRPLSIVRCPAGIAGEHFFQKNGHHALPPQIREGMVGRLPYLAIDDADGLIAMAQMSAVELHPWGATEADPMYPDRLVFDLDPGEGVAFQEVVKAAHEVRSRLERLGLQSFCRTTGGKGLHVVVPIKPRQPWEVAKPWCRAFAELLSQEQPEKFLPTMSKAERRGRILIDWLRNGLGATAVSSFCPRARPCATVATPLSWNEVTPKLDPASFTIRTIPDRLARLRSEPWAGFDDLMQSLPVQPTKSASSEPARRQPASGAPTRIIHARPPKRQSSR